MRSSFQRRFVIPLGVSFAVGLGISGYILNKFRSYEDSATRVMSGDQKAVLMGHLIEARVKASEELVQGSVSTQEANETFKEKVNSIADEIKGLANEHPDKQLLETISVLTTLSTSKSEAVEDLFVHYRNLKTSAFNLYRTSWANKWMTVAHTMGMIINDLDNLPYHDGEKAAASVYSKISQITSVVTTAAIPQASKLALFGQLGALKNSVARYTEASQRAEKSRAHRLEQLRAVGASLKKYNDAQGKNMMQFSNIARNEVFKSIIAFLAFIMFAFFWYMVTARTYAKHVMAVASNLTKQLAAWISAGGNLSAHGFRMPESADAEFTEMYGVLDQTMRRVNLLRREDILVKRLLNVPLLMINQNKQAIFWNSALSNLCKSRTLEEMGPSIYGSVVKFVDAQNKPIDPIEKAFAEGRDCAQVALLRANEDRVAVHVICTPVLGPDNKPEYVMVHIRDLREENRRFEGEVEKALAPVLVAIRQLSEGSIPVDAPAASRGVVLECMKLLKAHASGLQEKASVMAAQVETMQDRMAREGGLKKSVHGRMGQLKDELVQVRGQLNELRSYADGVVVRMGQMDARDRMLKNEYTDIKKRSATLLGDLKFSQELIGSCLKGLEEVEEISIRVRANDKMIASILEKSALLNANNSILGSKRELSPTDVVTITENIGQLTGQFQRSYRFMSQSVSDIERGVTDLASKLRSNLEACIKLAADDQTILKHIAHSEKALQTDSEDTRGLSRELNTLKAASGRISSQLASVENKAKSLVQIGQASLDLQNQLEHGFKGMFRPDA